MICLIVADSSFLIAAFRVPDGLHGRAAELYGQLEGNRNIFLITTHVFEETVEYIRRRDGAQQAFNAASLLLSAKEVSLEIVYRDDLAQAAQIMRKYGFLSLCDSLSVALARKHGLKQIVSFDSDFDKVERIRRVF